MKKLFSIGVFTLVMLTSCQNSNDEITPKHEAKMQSSKNMASKTTVSGPSDEAIINSLSGFMEANKLGPNDAFISCHDTYNSSSGNACVYVGGHLFNVTWVDGYGFDPSTGQSIHITTWNSTPVSHCGC